jgi:hypothetical protein
LFIGLGFLPPLAEAKIGSECPVIKDGSLPTGCPYPPLPSQIETRNRKMETVKIVGFEKAKLFVAISMAHNFMEQYPDRVGIYQGVAYSNTLLKAYVYRVKKHDCC